MRNVYTERVSLFADGVQPIAHVLFSAMASKIKDFGVTPLVFDMVGNDFNEEEQ